MPPVCNELCWACDRVAEGELLSDDGAMASNINRWMKYARARMEVAVGKGNKELDRLEAERDADLADRPWLRATDETPSLDEARARIRWESERADADAGAVAGASGVPSGGNEEPNSTSAGPAIDGSVAPVPPGTPDARSPDALRADAEAAGARLELETRQRESAARLDAIREELGIKPPPVSGPREPKAH